MFVNDLPTFCKEVFQSARGLLLSDGTQCFLSHSLTPTTRKPASLAAITFETTTCLFEHPIVFAPPRRASKQPVPLSAVITKRQATSVGSYWGTKKNINEQPSLKQLIWPLCLPVPPLECFVIYISL